MIISKDNQKYYKATLFENVPGQGEGRVGCTCFARNKRTNIVLRNETAMAGMKKSWDGWEGI